jgi:uncharacterized protein (TIGR02246 family)
MLDKNSSDEGAVRELLSRLNEAWMHKHGEEMSDVLRKCFADDVIMRGPGFSLAGRGRDLAVQSYQDFVSQARIKNVSLEPANIDVLEDTAVAQYKWEITYVLRGQEHTEGGQDLFVLSRRNGQWVVVWRALLT